MAVVLRGSQCRNLLTCSWPELSVVAPNTSYGPSHCPYVPINAVGIAIKMLDFPFTPVINSLCLAMLRINPNAVPFALTTDNKVPEAIRDTTFWDDGGDVLLITKDQMVVLFRKTLLLRYSETVRSLLGHIEKQPQDLDRWMPILELECNASELRAVLEYLLLQEQYVISAVSNGMTVKK